MTKENLTLELPNFEGPLDLLLHLIQSQKIDIYDIPISQITSQYLAYLKQMQKLNLQIAGEYFVMSSTLLRIKSQYLLPKNDFVDDQEFEDDPREELVQQLVQYSVFKNISLYFKKKNEELPVVLAKEASISDVNTPQPLPKGQISLEELTNSFVLILRKAKLRKPSSLAVKVEERSIDEMINLLQQKIDQEGSVSFFKCLTKLNNLSDIIGLFLACLELCKKGQVILKQNRIFGDFKIERNEAND